MNNNGSSNLLQNHFLTMNRIDRINLGRMNRIFVASEITVYYMPSTHVHIDGLLRRKPRHHHLDPHDSTIWALLNFFFSLLIEMPFEVPEECHY